MLTAPLDFANDVTVVVEGNAYVTDTLIPSFPTGVTLRDGEPYVSHANFLAIQICKPTACPTHGLSGYLGLIIGGSAVRCPPKGGQGCAHFGGCHWISVRKPQQYGLRWHALAI